MRVIVFLGYGQVIFAAFLVLLSVGCRRSSEELPVMPPATHPLAREYIGFGVVNGSFTHLLSEPGSGGVSHGYLRRGTVVRIIERRQVINRGISESWVLAEGNYQGNSDSRGSSDARRSSDARGADGILGWLQEAAVDIYDRESRASTASKAMNP